ncbi:MAG: DUF928 domain-containing protein [Nitrospiraceae bacterium]
MRFWLFVTVILLELSVGIPSQGFGAEDPPFPESLAQIQGSPAPIEPTMPVYKPRKGTGLRGRVDGGFRGGKEGEPVLRVLAPADHVGETVKKSPALYWYLSQTTSFPIVFTLEDTRHFKPVLQVTLKAPTSPGVQMIRLADYEKTLEEEVQYRWHIAVRIDPESPSKDIHAMGIIERIPYTEALFLGRSCRDPRDAVCLYAEAGLWYDAIMVISDLITANPNDRVLRLQRAALLHQVGLDDVAEYDRIASGP